MDFFVPGKIFELQRWPDDTLNGKFVGIVEKNLSNNKKYSCYIFEEQKVIENVTAAQLTYGNMDSDTKTKLKNILDNVIKQKTQHQINLAIKSEENEKRKLLEKQQKEEQLKIQAVLPNIVFDTNDIQPTTTDGNYDDNDDDLPSGHQLNDTMIVIGNAPNDLYQSTDNNDNSVKEKDGNVPAGYALVPVSTLNQVVNVQTTQKELKQKEIELQKQNNFIKKKEMDIINAQQKQLKQQTEQLQQIQKIQQEQQMKEQQLLQTQTQLNTQVNAAGSVHGSAASNPFTNNGVYDDDDYYENQIRQQQQQQQPVPIKPKSKKKDKKKKKYSDSSDSDDDYKDKKKKKKKRKKKKKKHKHKDDDCCTTKKFCKIICKISSLLWIIAIIGGIIGCFFFFLQNDDANTYAFITWGGAVFVAACGCFCFLRG